MSDDFDPELADALRRFAEAAPQPREDRVQAVIFGARRRQRRLVGASALGVVAVVAATALGVNSWRNTAIHQPAPAGSSGTAGSSEPVPSMSGIAPSLPPTPSGSPPPSPSGSPPTSPSLAPSTSAHHTASPSRSSNSANGQPDPKVDVQISPTPAVAGQQVHITVTVLNAGTADLPSAHGNLGPTVPNDIFDEISQRCTASLGGVECSTPALRPGQTSSLVFTVTTEWSPMGVDGIYGHLDYTDSHGQLQVVTINGQVPVIEGSMPSFPSYGAPDSSPAGDGTPSPSPAGSGAPNSTPSAP